MAQATEDSTLEMFRQAILEKANSERAEILRELEHERSRQLELAESEELEELYHRIQSETSAIRTGSIREVSREGAALKKEVYRQREQYITKMLSEVRARLAVFTKAPEYAEFLRKKAVAFSQLYPAADCVLKLRPEDEVHRPLLAQAFPGCTLELSESVPVGGLILQNRKAGVELDESLGRTLEMQKEWFYHHSGFKFE